jgi:O-acetylhomoserine/O-acetylserine sulfhydrylase-like pyridoxal-dependent enzyme
MDEVLTPEQWTDLQGILKQKYPQLTDSDLQYQEALEQDILQMIEYIVRITKNKMKRIVGKLKPVSALKDYWRDNSSYTFKQKQHES